MQQLHPIQTRPYNFEHLAAGVSRSSGGEEGPFCWRLGCQQEPHWAQWLHLSHCHFGVGKGEVKGEHPLGEHWLGEHWPGEHWQGEHWQGEHWLGST